MTSDKLNYLTVLAEEQNLTRAAKRLYITQPTLTAYINHLEKELGIQLFDRKHNPVRITKAGQVYIEKMKLIIEQEQQLINELHYLATPHNTIVIGIGQIHSELWCADLVERLLTKHSDINIQIRENKETMLLEYLKNEEIDLFLGHASIDSVNFHFETVFEETLLVLMPRNFLDYPETLLENNSPDNPYVLDPQELENLTMISPSASQGLFLNYQTLVSQYNLHPMYQIGTSNMITAVNMVAKGLGYLYCGPGLVYHLPEEQQKNIIFCTMPKLQTHRKFYCGYSEQNVNINLIRSTIQILKEYIEENPKTY